MRPRAGGTMNTTGFAFVHQSNRTMFQFARGEAFGERVGDFLELQRAFHGHRIAHMAAEEQERFRIHHLFGGFLHGLGLGVEDPLDLARHVLQGIQGLGDLVPVHGAFDLRQIQARARMRR